MVNPQSIPTFKKPRTDAETAALRQITVQNGTINLDQLVDVCLALGKMLQAVPKEERKFAVARIRNVAKANRENGEPPLTYLAFEALVRGWEEASHVT